jgi:hypothetical protein
MATFPNSYRFVSLKFARPDRGEETVAEALTSSLVANPLVSPSNTVSPVWLSCALSFLLGWPMLYDWVVFSTVTSIAAIGLYLSYGTHSNFIYPPSRALFPSELRSNLS